MSLRIPQATGRDTALAERLARMASHIDVLEHGRRSSWKNISLEAGWVVGSGAVQYLVENGVVRFRGHMKSGANEVKVWNMPVGLRPGQDDMYAAGSRDQIGQPCAATLLIFKTGDVWVYAEEGYYEISIAGITYIAEA